MAGCCVWDTGHGTFANFVFVALAGRQTLRITVHHMHTVVPVRSSIGYKVRSTFAHAV